MAIALESFEDIVRTAREEPLRQHFLLVFARAELPGDAQAEQVRRFHARQGGALVVVMYADKAEYELTTFEALVADAQCAAETLGKGMDAHWDLVIVGCLGGHAVDEPTPQEVDLALHDLLRAIRLGQSLAHLIAFDREGRPIHFE